MLKSTTNPRRVLAVMCVGMFLVLLDVTIVNVALPSIAAGLHGGVAALQWVIDGYAVAIAGLLLDRRHPRRPVRPPSRAARRAHGVRRWHRSRARRRPGTGCSSAARVVQGVGGALLLPTTMAVIADVFPDRAAQARALGTWAAASSLALPAGPILGGLLVDAASWRLVFWINVPVVAWRRSGRACGTVPASRPRRDGRFDVTGTIGFALGLAGLVFTVIEAGRGAGPAVVVASAAVSAGWRSASALRVERRAADPVLPLDLLRRRCFPVPQPRRAVDEPHLQRDCCSSSRSISSSCAGTRRWPPACSCCRWPSRWSPWLRYPAGSPPSAGRAPPSRAAARSRRPVRRSCSGSRPARANGWLVTAFLLLGCGAGLVTASVVAAVVRATPPERSGLATGVSNTARQTGTAAGVAIFGAITGSPEHATRFLSALHGLGAAVVTAAVARGVRGRGAGIEHGVSATRLTWMACPTRPPTGLRRARSRSSRASTSSATRAAGSSTSARRRACASG